MNILQEIKENSEYTQIYFRFVPILTVLVNVLALICNNLYMGESAVGDTIYPDILCYFCFFLFIEYFYNCYVPKGYWQNPFEVKTDNMNLVREYMYKIIRGEVYCTWYYFKYGWIYWACKFAWYTYCDYVSSPVYLALILCCIWIVSSYIMLRIMKRRYFGTKNEAIVNIK